MPGLQTAHGRLANTLTVHASTPARVRASATGPLLPLAATCPSRPHPRAHSRLLETLLQPVQRPSTLPLRLRPTAPGRRRRMSRRCCTRSAGPGCPSSPMKSAKRISPTSRAPPLRSATQTPAPAPSGAGSAAAPSAWAMAMPISWRVAACLARPQPGQNTGQRAAATDSAMWPAATLSVSAGSASAQRETGFSQSRSRRSVYPPDLAGLIRGRA